MFPPKISLAVHRVPGISPQVRWLLPSSSTSLGLTPAPTGPAPCPPLKAHVQPLAARDLWPVLPCSTPHTEVRAAASPWCDPQRPSPAHCRLHFQYLSILKPPKGARWPRQAPSTPDLLPGPLRPTTKDTALLVLLSTRFLTACSETPHLPSLSFLMLSWAVPNHYPSGALSPLGDSFSLRVRRLIPSCRDCPLLSCLPPYPIS